MYCKHRLKLVVGIFFIILLPSLFFLILSLPTSDKDVKQSVDNDWDTHINELSSALSKAGYVGESYTVKLDKENELADLTVTVNEVLTGDKAISFAKERNLDIADYLSRDVRWVSKNGVSIGEADVVAIHMTFDYANFKSSNTELIPPANLIYVEDGWLCQYGPSAFEDGLPTITTALSVENKTSFTVKGWYFTTVLKDNPNYITTIYSTAEGGKADSGRLFIKLF